MDQTQTTELQTTEATIETQTIETQTQTSQATPNSSFLAVIVMTWIASMNF